MARGRRWGMRSEAQMTATMRQDVCFLFGHGGSAGLTPWAQKENGYRARPFFKVWCNGPDRQSELRVSAKVGIHPIHGGEGP